MLEISLMQAGKLGVNVLIQIACRDIGMFRNERRMTSSEDLPLRRLFPIQIELIKSLESVIFYDQVSEIVNMRLRV